jgi:AcrR family transcriptional regulator
MRRRAKQERSQETIAVVLEAAARVLRREGYARATTNRIARAAGVSVGTIYQYFADKDAIFDALIHREIEGVLDLLTHAAPDPQQPLGDVLRGLLTAAVRSQPDGPVLYRSLEHVPNALFRRRLDEARERVIDFIRELLAARRRELHVRDLDVAAFVVVTATEGVAMSATSEFLREHGVEEIATLLTRYLTGGAS